MSDARIIELDGDWDVLESPEPLRARRISRVRSAGVIVLVLACLASLGAARRPPVPLLQLLGFVERHAGTPMTPSDFVIMKGMLLAQRDGRLVVYAPDGRRRWEKSLAVRDDEGYVNTRVWRDYLLVEQFVPEPAAEPGIVVYDTATTIALDPLTGAERWQIDGFVQPAGDFALLRHGSDPVRVIGSLPSDVRWTVPPARALTVDIESEALFTVTTDGLLTEFDLGSGAVRGSGQIKVPHVETPPGAMPPGVPGYPDEIWLEVFQDRIMLSAHLYGEYGPDTRAQTLTYERTTLRPVHSALDDFDFVHGCGPVVCAYSRDRVAILDPLDLGLLWQPAIGNYPYWTGAAMLLTGESSSSTRVVQPRTGAVLLDLDGWSPVDDRRFIDAPEPAAKPMWFTKFAPPGRTLLARLEGERLNVISPLPSQVVHCQAEDNVIACAMSDGRTGVWRINL